MNIEIFKGERLIRGALPYVKEEVAEFLAPKGFDVAKLPKIFTEAIVTPHFKILPVREERPVPSRTQVLTNRKREVKEDHVLITWELRDKSVEELRTTFIRRLADMQDRFLEDGFKYQDVTVPLTVEARLNIQSKVRRPEFKPFVWRGFEGEIAIETQADLDGFVAATDAAFEGSFEQREELTELIKLMELEELKEFDLAGEYFKALQ